MPHKLTIEEHRRIRARRPELPSGPVNDQDNPAWTKEDHERARPPEEVLPPEILAQFPNTKRRAGRPKAEVPKEHVSMRIAPDVLDYWKGKGKGWQAAIEAALRRAMEEERAAALTPIAFSGTSMNVLMLEVKDFALPTLTFGSADNLTSVSQLNYDLRLRSTALEVAELGRKLAEAAMEAGKMVRVSAAQVSARVDPVKQR